MKAKLAAAAAACAALVLVAVPAWADGGDVAYAAPFDVSIEDVFFSRLQLQIYNTDSTLRAQRVERGEALDTARWRKLFAGMTLWGETKAGSVATYDAAVRLFLQDPRAEYADAAERALYNGVLALADTTRAAAKGWREAAQAVLNAPATAYASRGCDLWVNLYFRNRTIVKNDSLDLVILQNTSAPWRSDVFFSLKFANGNPHMRLHLRLPSWMRSDVTPGGKAYAYDETRCFYQVMLNGRRLTLRAGSDGYITIDRTWSSDDVVRLTMPTVVRRIRNAAKKDGRFAVQEGPMVYVYPITSGKKFFNSRAPFGDNYDNARLHANQLMTREYPSRSAGEDDAWNAALLPYYVAEGRKMGKYTLWLDEIRK